MVISPTTAILNKIRRVVSERALKNSLAALAGGSAGATPRASHSAQSGSCLIEMSDSEYQNYGESRGTRQRVLSPVRPKSDRKSVV